MTRTIVTADTTALRAELHSLYEVISAGVCFLDADLRCAHVNAQFLTLTGGALGAPLGQTLQELAPAAGAVLERLCRHSVASRQPVADVEVVVPTASATARAQTWLASVHPAFDDHGQVRGVHLVIQDVTHRRRLGQALEAARDSLRERDAFLHTIADRLPRAFVYRVLHPPDGSHIFTYISKGVEAVAGLTADELFANGNLLLERIVDEDREAFVTAMAHSLETLTPFDFACRLRWSDASLHWCHFRSASRRLDDGMLACEGLMVDVSAQRLAEAALVDSEARNHAILSAQPDMMFLQSFDGTYLDASASNAQLLLVPKEVFLGRSMHDVLPPDLARAFGDGFLRVAREGSAQHEYSVEVHGEVRHFEARMVRCGVDRVLSIVRDITESRRAQQEVQHTRAELARVSRLTLLGEITASLAHELNQPLATILANAQAAQRLLAADAGAGPDLQAILADIVQADQRAGDVIRRTRAWLSRDQPMRQRLDVATVVSEVSQLVGTELIRRQARIAIDIASPLPAVLGDKIQIQQVLANLLLNGIEAMQDRPADERQLTLRAYADDDQVIVSVEDRGTGVHPDHLPRLFDAFFSTKDAGLGIGLRICASIVEAHGGRIWVVNNPGAGATFHFTLPAAPA